MLYFGLIASCQAISVKHCNCKTLIEKWILKGK